MENFGIIRNKKSIEDFIPIQEIDSLVNAISSEEEAVMHINEKEAIQLFKKPKPD